MKARLKVLAAWYNIGSFQRGTSQKQHPTPSRSNPIKGLSSAAGTIVVNESIVEATSLEWFGGLGYPPDLQEEAVKTVLAQAELLCAEWV